MLPFFSCPGLGSLCVVGARGSPGISYLRDALAVLPAEERGPGDLAGVLPLEEERLGLAVLEAEDLAVAADEDLTLHRKQSLASQSRNRKPTSLPGAKPQHRPLLPRSSRSSVMIPHIRPIHHVRHRAAGVIRHCFFSYLARVDPLSGERVVVGPHFVVGGRLLGVGVWRWVRVGRRRGISWCGDWISAGCVSMSKRLLALGPAGGLGGFEVTKL